MWIERLYKDRILRAADTFPAIFISGSRQCGKTSLVKKLFPDHEYISLDLPSAAEELETRGEAFLDSHSSRMIIDEVQYAPGVFRYLKNKIDKEDRRTQYILTGSQQFFLLSGISESLAGRCAVLPITPVFYQELDRAELIGTLPLTTLILKGGYPEIWKNPDMERDVWISSYISTYLERDIRNLLRIGSLRDFERFLRSTAFRCGSLLNYSDMAKDVGTAVSTIREWVSVLQASHQLFIVEPWFKNVNKRLVKSPKIYLADSGLTCFLNGIRDQNGLELSPLKGRIFENYIFNQIAAILLIKDSMNNLFFWRTSTGEEIDFILEKGGRYRLFEIKSSEHPEKKDINNIKMFKKEYGEKLVIDSFIICNTPAPYKIEDVNVISVSKLWDVF